MRAVVDDEEDTDSEITLNATTLLGIFFGLVLVCGVFFGFGYSIGRRGTEAPSATAPAASTPESAAPAATGTPKPSAMESLQTADTNASSAEDENAATEPTDTAPAPPPVKRTAQPAPAALTEASIAKPTAATKPMLKPASLPIAPGSGAVMVQIAAVTHQEDANVLVSALRQHGYSVSVHNEPQDKLLHIQVGPFATREAAKAMRAKLQADGYNAILKQ